MMSARQARPGRDDGGRGGEVGVLWCNRKLVVAVAMVVMAAGCAWTHPRADVGNTGANPGEYSISPATVGALQEQFRLPSATGSAVPWFVVGRGHVYVGGNPVRVFDSTGTSGCTGVPRVCTPQWSLTSGAGLQPDVFDGTLYRGGPDAFDADGVTDCSGAPKVCQPVWTEGATSQSGTTDPSALHLQWDFANLHATLRGYATTCPPSPAACPRRWAGETFAYGAGGAAATVPATDGTRVFAAFTPQANPATSTLYAWNGTQSDGTRQWSAQLPGWTSFVAVSDGIVITPVQTPGGGELLAFDAAGIDHCTGSPAVCQPLWVSDLWTSTGDEHAPAIAHGVVYRAVGSQLRAYDLRPGAGCAGSPGGCPPRWTATTGSGISAPAVAGGLVFVGDTTGHVAAFDAAGVQQCAPATHVCQALWDTTLGTAAGPPEVSAGRVYVGAFDGTVRVFGPPS